MPQIGIKTRNLGAPFKTEFNSYANSGASSP